MSVVVNPHALAFIADFCWYIQNPGKKYVDDFHEDEQKLRLQIITCITGTGEVVRPKGYQDAVRVYRKYLEKYTGDLIVAPGFKVLENPQLQTMADLAKGGG